MTWAKVFWSFEGRIPRRTYWAAIGIWLGVIMVVAGGMSALFRSSDHSLGGLVIIALIIPYLWSVIAIQAKRWHDRGKSGAMVLINLIPYVGGIWCFVECGCLRGDVGGNRYGGDPT